MRRVTLFVGLAVMLIGILLCVHFFVRPLDVVAFQVLRRIGE